VAHEVQLETAITARLYFVLFSGAANSNNKLSPILPLQPELPIPPPPLSRLPPGVSDRTGNGTASLPPHVRAGELRSSFESRERFVSRTFVPNELGF